MTAFELSFTLISLLLGLAFAHIAGAFAQLVVAGRKVRWDWLPPLAALVTLQFGLVFWWSQWALRDRDVVLAELSVRAIACLALYVTAVAVLPEAGEGPVDLSQHFQRSRKLIYASLFALLLIVGIAMPAYGAFMGQRAWFFPWENLLVLTLMAIGFFSPNRLLNGAILGFIVLLVSVQWFAVEVIPA